MAGDRMLHWPSHRWVHHWTCSHTVHARAPGAEPEGGGACSPFLAPGGNSGVIPVCFSQAVAGLSHTILLLGWPRVSLEASLGP